MRKMKVGASLPIFLLVLSVFISVSSSQRLVRGSGIRHQMNSNGYRFGDRFAPVLTAASQHVSQQVAGYHYPVPASTNIQIQKAPLLLEAKPTDIKEVTTVPSTTETSTAPTTISPITKKSAKIQQVPASLVHKVPSVVLPQTSSITTTPPPITTSSSGKNSSRNVPLNLEASPAEPTARLLHAHHSPQIQTIDVACGKEKMTVRVSFDQAFNGVIYAKGHYNDEACKFTAPSQGLKVYQFEMIVGQCGVAYIDSGLTDGGQAYVEGMLVIILEPGVQEAWDAAKKIRCLWEGHVDQTVTYPLTINMLDSQTLTFSGDTVQANLEIQMGRGPRAAPIQGGLVRVGELLTAVVTVQGDPDFDLIVRNCIATDGTPNNRIILSDNRGCAVKTKLMGGWQKQKNSGTTSAYSYLSAFKFPDFMDLFLECMVSLCKGKCEECPEYVELHVPSHDHDHDHDPQDETQVPSPTSSKQPQPSKIEVRTVRRTSRISKRSAAEIFNDRYNETLPSESLRLRRVLHVVGPDDLPELGFQQTPSVYGGPGGYAKDCFTALGVVTAVTATIALMLISLAVFGVLRRQLREEKC